MKNKDNVEYDKTISVILTHLFDKEKQNLPESSKHSKDIIREAINNGENDGLQ